MAVKTISDAISTFGASAKAKLSNAAIEGAPEDQLRNPLETLVRAMAELCDLPAGSVELVGETHMGDLKIRPDFAVTAHKALVGFIEVKAPGKGADPRHFTNPHDKEQWQKLKALPNLLYRRQFVQLVARRGDQRKDRRSRWRRGDRRRKTLGTREPAAADQRFPDVGADCADDGQTTGENIGPAVPPAARRGDRATGAEQRGLTALKKDWRKLLFPQADDRQFADGYAQAVTFGLLVARAMDIPLASGIHQAAYELRKSNSLIGTALGLLTDDEANQQALKTSLKTLTRVLDKVNWATISKDKPEAWLYFYEDFLEVYDKALKRQTGSYYTPPEVVAAMVRLVDDTLRRPIFGRAAGLASTDVTLADPAVGTGTFLLGVMRRIAEIIAHNEGKGAVRGAVEAAAQRLIGFELQFGPFAVAQLRLIAEMQALMKSDADKTPKAPDLKLFITDTLGNPFIEEEALLQVGAIAKSRRDANAIKKTQKITVVLGNPPYKEKAKGRGGWIESGSGGKLSAPMDWWAPPRDWGVGAHTKHLKNLYVYFWRWATWKVFGTGRLAATGLADKDEEGIVCFITVAGFLGGPGFQRMRDDLRRTCSDIWVVDCSPDGHQPVVSTRIFQGVQQPVCIVLAAKALGKDREKPAHVRFRALPKGHRDDKFAALEKLSLDGPDWADCPTGWREPFFPEATGDWASFPPLKNFFSYDGSGVMPGRTWIIAPDAQSLNDRWARLTAEKDAAKKETLFHPHQTGDKTLSKKSQTGLAGHDHRPEAVNDDPQPAIQPARYGFRSLDRQWIIPDARLINRPNPALWNTHSPKQVYLTALDAHSPTSGPSITFTGTIPDLHHYKGSFGGRAFPLWADAAAKKPNVDPTFLKMLADSFGEVSAGDAMAYLAAVMAHPAFTKRFLPDLVQPGLRVPLTADAGLFAEAVALGYEIIWLHTYGERFVDPEAGRPKAPPRMAPDLRPFIPAEGAIPGAPEALPDTMDYDAVKRRLIVGKGFVENVSPEMWAYEVSGKQAVWHWFSYRRHDRSRPQIGDKRAPSPLDFMQPDHWLAEYTTDLIDLLNVLGRLVALEPAQAELLGRIIDAEKIDLAEVQKALAAEPAA